MLHLGQLGGGRAEDAEVHPVSPAAAAPGSPARRSLRCSSCRPRIPARRTAVTTGELRMQGRLAAGQVQLVQAPARRGAAQGAAELKVGRHVPGRNRAPLVPR